jgi:uncharacterized protein YfkK (UPF0435 family)
MALKNTYNKTYRSERRYLMDLSLKNKENMEFMLEEIKKKLQLVNKDVIQSKQFSEAKYDELKELYELVMKMKSFSLKEIEGILAELKGMRS